MKLIVEGSNALHYILKTLNFYNFIVKSAENNVYIYDKELNVSFTPYDIRNLDKNPLAELIEHLSIHEIDKQKYIIKHDGYSSSDKKYHSTVAINTLLLIRNDIALNGFKTNI